MNYPSLVYFLVSVILFGCVKGKSEMRVSETDYTIEIVSKFPTCAKCDFQLTQLIELANKHPKSLKVEYIQPYLQKNLRTELIENGNDNFYIIYNTKLYHEKSSVLAVPYLLLMNKDKDTLQVDFNWNFNLSTIEELLLNHDSILNN